MNLVDDNALLARIAKGDSYAFLALYDRYASRVYALAIRILHDSMLAEEATQDTFLKIWARANQFIPERGSALAWLLTITRRTALDRVRLEARRPQLTDTADLEEVWPNIPDPDSVSDEQRWHSLHLMVRNLSAEHRQVIELAYYQGLSQSDIAEVLGWPLGTVKTRLRAAMEQLRRAWGEK